MLLAVSLGALLGGLGAAGQHWRLAQLRAQGAQLQAQVQSQLRQQSAAAALRSQALLQQALLARAQEWGALEEQSLRLHGVLGEQGETLGLRVTRWQNDGRQLQLHAWLPRAQDVPLLISSLSAAGRQAWALQSLGEHASPPGSSLGGVDLVLQAPWQALKTSTTSPLP